MTSLDAACLCLSAFNNAMKQHDPIKTMSTAELRAAYRDTSALTAEQKDAIVRFACLREENERQSPTVIVNGWKEPSPHRKSLERELLAKH